jgi:hypothetical protein
MDNLVVIYENLVDQTGNITLTASSTAGSTSLSNLANNTKSKVWRSTATSATFLAALSPSRNVTSVAIPFCNLTATATIRVRGFSSNPTLSGTTVVGGTQVWDSGTILACPWASNLVAGLSTPPSGVSVYSYGGGKHARCYVPNNDTVTGITIELVDTSNTAGYIEAARLVIGSYWSPTFNTSYGLSIEPVDLSKHERTDSGDLVTTTLPKFNKLSFDLKYLNEEDRVELIKIIRTNGYSIPMFVSLFPYATDANKERDYQIFGKVSSISPITHPTLSIYSSQLILEEV